MGSANWTELTGNIVLASLDRGVTTGIARPNGGGSFVYGFNSLDVSVGAAALYTNQANFNPTPANKGGSIRGAIKRGASAAPVGFSPFFFLLAQGTTINDVAYILGLQDDNPHRIAIRKGQIVNGVPTGAVTSPVTGGILRVSTATFNPDTYLHLRLDAVVNLNGDVILKAYQSDLGANPVTAPVWTPIPGLEDENLVASHGAGTCFVDDTLEINSGSAPYTSGYMGYGFQTTNISRRGFFDQIESSRQS